MSKKEIEQSPEQKVIEIAKDYGKLEKKSEKIIISDEKQYAEANAFIVEIKGRINRVKALKNEYVKPLKENIKKLESLFTDPIKNYEKIEFATKRLMSDFRIEEERKAREEEEKLRKQQEKEAEKAEKKGEPAPIAPIATVERVAPTIKTEAGKSTASKVVKFKITDANKLPKKIRDAIYAKAIERGLAEQFIRPIVKVEGMNCKITGIRVYEDFDISVTA